MISKNIKHIIRREYLVRVKKKSFLIMTFLAPFILILFSSVVAFLISGALNEDNQVYVYDKTHQIEPILEGGESLTFIHTDPSASLDSIKKSLDYEKSNYLLIIDPSDTASIDSIEKSISLYSENSPGLQLAENIEGQIQDQLTKMRLQRKGINYAQVDSAQSDLTLKIINEENKNVTTESLVARGVAFLSFFMMYFFVFAYGARVMRSVMEEKTSRVVELMLSSVKPRELMMGKILGNTLVSFTQFVIWLIMGGIALGIAQSIFGTTPQPSVAPTANADTMAQVSEVLSSILDLNIPLILVTFIIYFLFGFLTYSALFAAIGALVDNQQDAQQFLLPVMIPMMLTLYASFGIIENPNSTMAEWLSIIPITSPISMMARVPFGLPTWQLLLSIVLLILFFLWAVRFSAKLYRVGILASRGKPTYKEVTKWLREN